MQQKLTLGKAARPIIFKLTEYSGKENHEGGKGKQVPKLQEKIDQVCSRPIQRNLAGLKGGVGFVQSAELETYAAKNSLFSKAVIQNRRREKKVPRQTKFKGVCDR